jgi:hypothetical protein
MVIRQCQECGGSVSSLAESCPHCGYGEPRKRRTVLALSTVVTAGSIILGLLLGYVLLVNFVVPYHNELSRKSQEAVDVNLPTCDSDKTIQTVKKVFTDSRLSPVVKEVLFDIQDISEVEYDGVDDIRYCEGTAYLNYGERHIEYKIEWLGHKRFQAMISIRGSH